MTQQHEDDLVPDEEVPEPTEFQDEPPENQDSLQDDEAE